MGGFFSRLKRLFTGPPDEFNDTNANIQKYHEMRTQALEMKEKAEADAADAQRRVEESAQREAEAKKREEEALQRELEAKEREADILRREAEAKLAAEQARLDVERAKQQGEDSEKREKEAKEKEEEAKRLAEDAKQAALDAQKRELEANARVLETQKREAEARKMADEARKREEEVQKDLQQAKFYLEKGIQPEVWPTKEEFQLAKNRIQYDPEKLHFAVCGSSGSGKSSLVNAFRGLKNSSSHAARTGVVETTMAITRYPDPHKELPFKRFVWFDCPGAGTLEVPGWQYFNQQGLFIFDIIVLVYDTVNISINLSNAD
jgi:Interferon-inducible GTPase (IIGP)